MFQLIDPKRFKQLQARMLELDDSVLDAGIRDVVKALNQLPGVCTVWSCEGHVQEDCDTDRMYISFVVLEGHVASLERIYKRFAPYAFEIGSPVFSLSDLTWVPSLFGQSDLPTYPIFTISMVGNFEDPQIQEVKVNLLCDLVALEVQKE